jgi:hypothetical protein
MQLIKIDLVQAQAAQATFARGPQVFWPSVLNLLVGTRPREAALGSDDQVLRIRM